MSKKKKRKLKFKGILIFILFIVVIFLGIKFLPEFMKPSSKEENNKYGIKDSYTIGVKNNVTTTARKNYYSEFDYKNRINYIYDLKGNLVLKYDYDDSKVGHYDYDDKYIYIYNWSNEIIEMYDINQSGKKIFDGKHIIELNIGEEKYFIDEDRLLNYDLEEVYKFKSKITPQDHVSIYKNILYTTEADNNICIDLNNFKTVYDNYDQIIMSDDYIVFNKDNTYHLFKNNKEVKTYEKLEMIDYFIARNWLDETPNKKVLKLTSKDNVEYIIENKIISSPELKLEDKVIDFENCTIGGKVKKDGKIIVDKCLYNIDILGDVVIGVDKDDHSVMYVNGKNKTEEETLYEKKGNYVEATNYLTGFSNIYDAKGKLIGKYALSKFGDIYVKYDGDSYFLDKDLNVISDSYDSIMCNSVNGYCMVRNDDENEALFYGTKQLTEFVYTDIEIENEIITLKDWKNMQVLILDKNGDNFVVPKVVDKDLEKIDIAMIKRENELEFEIPEEYEELFKKYAYVVENNDGVKDYKKYVYDLFQVITDKNVNKYLNELYFFKKLSSLSITVDHNIGYAGLYTDSSTTIQLNNNTPVTIYHELMHFVDFSINSDNDTIAWYCGKKVLSENEGNKLSDAEKEKCETIDLSEIPVDYLIEGGAELYSAKYFKKGIVSYVEATGYLTGIEYIIGSENMDKLFFGKNSKYSSLKLYIDSGFTLQEYKDIMKELSVYTYPFYNVNTEQSGRLPDSLIDLYKLQIKDKKWTEDKTFIYIIRSMSGVEIDYEYKNSKYKDEIDKIAFKSFNSYNKYTDELMKDLDKKIDFSISPIPVYIINDELYLGTIVEYEEINHKHNILGYIKYDFENNKLLDYKYPIYK